MHATVSAVTRSRHIRPPENASLLAVLLRNCTYDVRYIFGDLPHCVGCCLNPQKASGARRMADSTAPRSVVSTNSTSSPQITDGLLHCGIPPIFGDRFSPFCRDATSFQSPS